MCLMNIKYSVLMIPINKLHNIYKKNKHRANIMGGKSTAFDNAEHKYTDISLTLT